jgi:hypothetical protein
MSRLIIAVIVILTFATYAIQAIGQTSISTEGVIESKSGGFKFPDGSIQETAFTIPIQSSAYLTPDLFDAANATGQCADGFHFASAIELQALSPFVYNNILGLQKANRDTGDGPPDSKGWVRTGQYDGSPSGNEYNCDGWTSSAIEKTGVIAFYSISSLLAGGNAFWFDVRQCSNNTYVWCISDAVY